MYKKILMAYDGSPEYRRALRQGSELAELTNAEVHLLAVIRSSAAMPMAGGVNTSEVVNEEHNEVQKLLNDGVERIRERRHVECTGSIGYGDPVDEIENAARDFDADLVVIGTRKLAVVTGASSGLGLYGAVSLATRNPTTDPAPGATGFAMPHRKGKSRGRG